MHRRSVKYIPLRVLTISLLISFNIQMSAAGTIAPSAGATRTLFASDLMRGIMTTRTGENVVYSPASIQACLAMAFLGAEGETANELRSALHLGVANKEMVARNFGDFLKSIEAQKSLKLQMANRIYVNRNAGELASDYERISKEHFSTKAVQMNFKDGKTAAGEINKWISEKTFAKIKNIINADAISEETSAILVNAIYFKAKWATPFSLSMTRPSSFRLSSGALVPADMMTVDDSFKYAELSDLDATAVQLPYADSDISMLIILPNKLDGLKQLEEKLSTKTLTEVSSKLEEYEVVVSLPRFRIEQELDLKQTLTEMGMGNMFSNKANFKALFASGQNQRVSDVRHKAFLDVNEAGSEAAAASFIKLVPMSLNFDQKTFNADHPFIFAICSRDAVYFTGHVVKI